MSKNTVNQPKEKTHLHTARVRFRTELSRKAFHLSIGFLTLFLYQSGFDVHTVQQHLLGWMVVAIAAEYVRFQWPLFNQLYTFLFGFLMRPDEWTSKINGTCFYFIGCTLVVYLFPTDIATLSVVLLSWVDPIASATGKKFGKYTLRLSNGKTLAGFVGSLLTGFVTTWCFWSMCRHPYANPSWTVNNAWSLWQLSLFGAVTAAGSEIIEIYPLDDNLLIPLICGTAFWLLLCTF